MLDGIIHTIPARCKRCYSCIRECPAKAISVVNGQAVVLDERCIACGHCVKVCSQEAKLIKSDKAFVLNWVLRHGKAVAILAPSFAASFTDNYKKIPTVLRDIGFDYVMETAFGADLISPFYLNEFENNGNKTIISSSCPAVINYIEKYYPDLVPNLAKIVSPMIAMGRYIKENLGRDYKVVFIGPCVAKKDEIRDENVSGEIDAVLTFTELKEILKIKQVNVDEAEISNFDPPYAFYGKSFPLAGGLLKATNLSEDILEKEIIVVEGKSKVVEIIDELANNKIHAKFIDILFCEGCISGPAIDSDLNYYSRRQQVVQYIKEGMNLVNKQVWKSNVYNSRNLDLSREFTPKNQRLEMPAEDKIKEILTETNKHSEKEYLNCGACGYATCREFAVNVVKGLAEKEMCLPFLIEELQNAYEDLRTTQEQLHSAEKLASIGQLAAGVAHEINNPLGTIMLYSSLLIRYIEEKIPGTTAAEDLNLIINEANRCKNIVSNLLNFARQGKLTITNFNLQDSLENIIKSIKVNPKYKDVFVELINSSKDCRLDGDKDQLEQVFLNLVVNACEAMDEKPEKSLWITIYDNDNNIMVDVKDNGIGIPNENFKKIFTPFFTTKKIGKGTGLGLAITYGIIKMHKGEINFTSELNNGTTFKVKLPKNLLEVNINN
jgi:iron only hydrogenase large subunit-like protein/nitrogen-specific signal transduction histidine kinase